MALLGASLSSMEKPDQQNQEQNSTNSRTWTGLIYNWLFPVAENKLEQENNLLEAVENNKVLLVQLAIDNGANVNIQNKIGATPLIIAIQNQHKAIVEMLLDNGAEVNFQGKWNFTPLMIAAGNGLNDILLMLLDKGADIDAQNMAGCTALMFAIKEGSFKVTRTLLIKGANIDIKDKEGNTAVSMIAQKGWYIVEETASGMAKEENQEINECKQPAERASSSSGQVDYSSLPFDYNKINSQGRPKSKTETWLSFAAEDYEASKILIASRLLRPALYHAQQCAEKSLKAYLAHHQKQFERIHKLEQLLKSCIEFDEEFRQFHCNLVELSKLAARVRYPDSYGSKKLSDQTVEKLIRAAQELLQFVKHKIKS